jgi:ATP-dependent DNA ligase
MGWQPLQRRREKLETFSRGFLARNQTIELSPRTEKVAMARRWLESPKAKLDGVIAKRKDLPYRSGERDGMQKIKRLRTADCIVAGFRYAAKDRVVGSLL